MLEAKGRKDKCDKKVQDCLVELGSEKEIKNAGKMRLEGKDYVVNDGDVIFFRFNV